MNVRVTWLLVLVALGLGGYLGVVERHAGVKVSGSDGVLATFLPVAPELVTAVELLHSNGVVRVERMGKDWNLRLPVADAAQNQAVEALLAALGRLRPQSWISPAQIGPSETDLSAFGLGNGAATLKLETTTGPVIFKLGGSAPFGDQFYFQRIGNAGVFLADGALRELFPASADAWRDRRLVRLPDPDFDRFELRGRTAFEAEKNPVTGIWRLTKPLAVRADSDRLNAVLHALLTVRIAQFVTDSPGADLETFGLRPAEAEVLVGRGTNTLAQLQFGRPPTNNPGGVYVRRLTQTNVVLVPAATALALRGPLGAFRDHRLLPPLEDSTRLEFIVGAEHTVVEKSGTNWVVTAPVRFPAQTDLVNYLFTRVGSTAITDFPNDVVADYGSYGLTAPGRTYAFTQGTNAPLQLHFGAQPDSDHVFVRRLDEAGVYVVRYTDLLQLPETAAQLRDFRFASSNVVKVAIRQKGNVRTLMRGADGQWGVTAGPAAGPFSPAVEETLHRLGDLATSRYAVRDEAMFTQLRSFTELGHEISLTFGPDATLRTLRLRFVTDLGTVAIALANFDDDPMPLRLELPGALFQDVRRDFSGF